MKFEIGDRVKCIEDYAGISKGDLGFVKQFHITPSGEEWLGIEWDKVVSGGHGCDGTCDSKRGYRLPQKFVILERVMPPVNKKELESKIKKIVSEISKNKNYVKCFGKDIEKEVRKWTERQIMSW